ncbi:DUF4124 domain-containing protein [Nitrosomonas communis]|uniref:DUF4124 domain-containing protein n=1 Tax=Nitrosomonas communis TaxID=44574 RepID=UPI0026ED0D57|nr:DUF4124 domain-containing protein [Nitrosomonas communis]MCO6426958.1 DUF4124 domain-containing protein [Nitrosomonas communis]
MPNFMIVILLYLLAGNANGQVYKWVDGMGKVQYSDQLPPAGASKNEKMIDIQSSSQSANDDGKGGTKDIAEKEQPWKEKRAARGEAKSKQLAEANMKKENCLRARSNLELLRNSERLSVPDGNGGIIDVDDHLRQQYTAEALNNIATYCQ